MATKLNIPVRAQGDTGRIDDANRTHAKVDEIIDEVTAVTATANSATQPGDLGALATKNQVASTDIEDGAVGGVKIGSNAVSRGKIVDGAVDEAKLSSTVTALLGGRIKSDTAQANGGTVITNMVAVTAAQYAAIGTKDPNTIYLETS